jgi:polar amino acid transport system permease protein
MPTLPEWVGPVAEYMLETGLKNTIRTAVISVVLSGVIGVVLGTLMTIRLAPLRAAIRVYIEVWRGLPIIVTLFIVHFALPSISTRLEFDPFTSGTVALTLWGSAQVAEATRGAVQSIHREQHEAAAALGFGWVGRHVFVILPQAYRRLIPPLVSLLVGVILNTTLIQVIGGSELLETGEQSVERLGAPPPVGLFEIHAFKIYGAVAAVFFLICFPLTRLASMLERRLVA